MGNFFTKSLLTLVATYLSFGMNLFAGDTIYCYFWNHDRQVKEYVSISLSEYFESSSTKDYLDQEGDGVRSFGGSGYLLDSFLYEIDSAKATELVQRCTNVSKNKNVFLEKIVRAGNSLLSYNGYPFVFKGLDNRYFRLELPREYGRTITLNNYVLEKSGYQNPLLSSVVEGIDKVQSYHNVADFSVISKSIRGAEFLLNPQESTPLSKDVVRDIMWYISFKAAKNGNLFKQGAFLIHGDLQEKLFNILNVHSHSRSSTHLKYLSDTSEHKEVSFGSNTILAGKRTALFFQVNKKGLNHLYIKPEDYSLDGFYDTLGHIWETIPSILRKWLPQNRFTGDDHAIEYRKERIDTNTSYYNKYVLFVEEKESQHPQNIKIILDEYKKYGIFTMYQYLNQFENDMKAQEILDDLEQRYQTESLAYRIGDEIHVKLDKDSVASDLERLKGILDTLIHDEINQFHFVDDESDTEV